MPSVVGNPKERLASLKKHPTISSFAAAVSATRSGISELTSGTQSELPPPAYGPVDGPAPVENTERSPVVRATVQSAGVSAEVEIQFWKPRDGGAIVCAWKIGDKKGERAVYHHDSAAILLDDVVHGKYTRLSLGEEEVQTAVWNAYAVLIGHNKLTKYGVSKADDSLESSSGAFQAQLTTQTGSLSTSLEPWQSKQGDAVYVSWEIGDYSGDYAVKHAAGLWLGLESAFVAPEGVSVPFVCIEDEELDAALSDEIEDMASEEADAIEVVEHIQTTTSNHPESPEHSTSWGPVDSSTGQGFSGNE